MAVSAAVNPSGNETVVDATPAGDEPAVTVSAGNQTKGYSTVSVYTGATYTLRASGTYRYFTNHPDDPLADAFCSLGYEGPDKTKWIPSKERFTDPDPDTFPLGTLTLNLTNDGTTMTPLNWTPVDPFEPGENGDEQCSESHVYEATWNPADMPTEDEIEQRTFRLFDINHGDNEGSLSLSFSRSAPTFGTAPACGGESEAVILHDILQADLQVDANAQDGETSCHIVVTGGTYLVTVSGTFRYYADNATAENARADAHCSTDLTGQIWSPSVDALRLFMNGERVEWRPASPTLTGCDGQHTYTAVVEPEANGRLTFTVNENATRAWRDNDGSLGVTIENRTFARLGSTYPLM